MSLSRRQLLRGVGGTGIAAGLVGVPTAGARQNNPRERVIVGLEPGRANIAREAAGAVYRELDFGEVGAAVAGWYSTEALVGLANNPHVRYIEVDGEMHAIDHTVDEAEGDPTQEQVLPWGIDRVDADLVHHDGETGAGSSIAIIDTGIDPDHESLHVDGGVAFVNARGPYSEDWADDHGHGTHCAGTANALDNGTGVVGVSTAAELYAVKVLDNSGSGSFSDVAAGIEWTADQGIHVGSLSLGASSGSEAVADACTYAYGKGTLLVAAAGNSGPDEDTVGYPAAYPECIAVSATDDVDDIASFSSRGEEVELAAPGVNVLSTLPGDDYDAWNGTSMACPHVSGAGAQLMEHGHSNVEARDRLNETAEDIGLADTEQGSGLLDVAEALNIEETGGEETALAVETNPASDVGETLATLNGELTELEGHDNASVHFEWGESGSGFNNTTDAQTLDAPDSFDDTVSGLDPGTEYAFQAVAEADGDTDTGATFTFTTDSDDDGEETTAPVIETFDLTDRSNPRWARVRVDWAVSDADGKLDTVESVLTLDGTALDSETSSVSGSEASGDHDLRERNGHGETYDVTLTVTDTDGNSTDETKQITL